MVVADDRYIAADAVELVEVEYEPLPVLVDPHKALDADAPILREDVQDKDTVGQGPRRHPNHIFTWEVGDEAATDRAFEEAEVTVPRRCTTRGCTQARWRPAAAWHRSTKSTST